MTKKIVFGVAGVALAAFVMAPSASASCNPSKSANTYANGNTAYWHSSIPGSDNSSLVGQSWQLGAPGNWNSAGGAVPCANFLYFSGGNNINLNLDLGGCGAGCVSTGGTIAVLAQNKGPLGSEFLLATVTETLTGNTFFDYAAQGDHNMVILPKPRVTSSSRAGGNINLGVQVQGISSGFYGPNAASGVAGFRILSAASATNPGRNAAAYSLRSSITSAGGAPATGALAVDCSNPNLDQWVVTQLLLEGGIVSDVVSEATRVNCNPALADPKYKIVPKRGTPRQPVVGGGSNN